MAKTDWIRQAQALGRRARAAACALRAAGTQAKDAALHAMAGALREQAPGILRANAADLADARKAGLADALLDRLTLTAERIEKMAAGVREVAALRDPVGEVIEGYVRPSGLRIERVRVPLGVILLIYE